MTSKSSLALSLLQRGNDPGSTLVALELLGALEGCDSVLDVGCGPSSILSLFGLKRLAGIDGYAPAVEAARAARTHDEMHLGDIREMHRYFPAKAFDAAVALDVIEHLSKEDGYKLMESMERVAAKRVIFFTPSGFLPQKHTSSDDLQEHLSGWTADEMRSRGYDVMGMLGPKTLRGEYHVLKRKPRLFWGMMSLAGHFASTKHNPDKAAAILCVKRQDGK